MAESMSVRLPYAVGVQLRRLADHYNTPITGVLADLIKRESKACDIPLADAIAKNRTVGKDLLAVMQALQPLASR